ncbi:MAG: YicC/YloC family endoribonuclease, partial [Puniceicoccales bacterium]
MHSMTGYGRAQLDWQGRSIALEVSSVNRRNLEITTSLPREWQSMDRVIGDCIRGRFARGKFHVQLQVRRDESAGAAWDAAGIQKQFEALRDIVEANGEQLVTDGNFWLRLAANAQENESEPDWEKAWAAIEPVLNEALDALGTMRLTEGKALADDIRARLDQLDGWRGEIAELAKESPVNYREVLMERLKKANLELDPDDERVLKEIAIFADRCDVEEELTRLSSHLSQFREAIEASEPIGRKMDFMCQEINREVNTIGSKANNLEITRLVIDCKNELER